MIENIVGATVLSEEGEEIGTCMGVLLIGGHLHVITDLPLGSEGGDGGEEASDKCDDNILKLINKKSKS